MPVANNISPRPFISEGGRGTGTKHHCLRASYLAQGMTGQGQVADETLSVPGILGDLKWLLQALELIPKRGTYQRAERVLGCFEGSFSCQGGKKLGWAYFRRDCYI